MPTIVKQKIPARYIDRKILTELLLQWFGSQQFEFEVADEEFLIITLYDRTKSLSDAQLEIIRERCFS
ncbi:uncharacterized protein TrAtP1_011814 [Trichoderma atroviride]|uniref:uncharacterized protein n=1 Tax=Hypocrea atroviridis TaxID=63577 RepID=UPI0033286E43|nr:hypothetical protein TrAtP1_011814 [Trichoderma atroviride]